MHFKVKSVKSKISVVILKMILNRDLREKMQPFGRFHRPADYEQMFNSLQSTSSDAYLKSVVTFRE